MKTIIEEDYVNVSFIEENRIIKVIWLANCNSDEYRKTYEKILADSKKDPYDNFFVDITKQKIISPIDRKWFEDYVMPEAVKLGLKRAAVVLEGNVFKRYYVNNILSKTNRFSLPMKAFTSYEEAENWFKSFS